MDAKEIANDIIFGKHDPRFVSPEIRCLARAYLALDKQMEELKGENDGLTLALLRFRKRMEGNVLMPENPTPEWVRWYRNETGCGLPKAIKDYKAMIAAKEE